MSATRTSRICSARSSPRSAPPTVLQAASAVVNRISIDGCLMVRLLRWVASNGCPALRPGTSVRSRIANLSPDVVPVGLVLQGSLDEELLPGEEQVPAVRRPPDGDD